MYTITPKGIFKDAKDGQQQLSNFTAEITDEINYVDGRKTDTHVTVKGKAQEQDFDSVTMTAKEFSAMSWPSQMWGMRAIVYPGNVKDDLRVAIMQNSEPKRMTVYTHTGWTTEGKRSMYLHAGGAITHKGPSTKTKVELPHELRNFKLPDKITAAPQEAWNATFTIAATLPDPIGWSALAAIIRPVLTRTDFTLHFTGRTGSFKSELAAICQSHYGAEINARNLPGSWSSTPNALEAQAYRLKDALFVIDDFIPSGTSWQQRQLNKTADQLIRAQGNQAGRARLTDTSTLQTTYYPRGQILSTGEDTPEGHSCRARMLIIELAPGDITPPLLTRLQELRPLYSQSLALFIQWIAADYENKIHIFQEIETKYRDQMLDIGHSRTPGIIAQSLAAITLFLQYAQQHKWITDADLKTTWTLARESLIELGTRQGDYLTAADPTDILIATLRTMLSAHVVHLRSPQGGVPKLATIAGWTEESGYSDIPTYKSHGKSIGWIDHSKGEVQLDDRLAYELIKRHARGDITVTKQTLYRRLKDAGKLANWDEKRQRNTVRRTTEGVTRLVVALKLQSVFDAEELT